MIKWRIKSFSLILFYLFFQINSKNSPQSLSISENEAFYLQNESYFQIKNPDLNSYNLKAQIKTNKTCDRKCFLERTLGPRTKSLMFTVCMSSLYFLILLTGIFGNITTCLVIIYNNCMHTTTNYYIFSLAVSDVLFLIIGLPMDLHSLFVGSYPWAFGHTLCIFRTYLFEATTNASVLTILAFTFERWLHICKSIYAKKFSNSFSRAIKIILLLWFISGVIALPFALTTGTYYAINENYPESKICATKTEYNTLMKNIILLSLLLFFVVPMTLISNMYILIGIKLWKSQKLAPGGCNYDKIRMRKFKKKRPKEEVNILLTTRLQTHRANFKEDNEILKDKTNTALRNVNTSQLCDDKMLKVVDNRLRYQKSFRQSQENRSELENIPSRARQSRRDCVKILFFVVLGFFICWAPFHLQRLWTIMSENISNVVLFEFLYYVSGVSIYISSTINPILYNLMSERYRRAFISTFKMILSCKFPGKGTQKYQGTHLYYYNKKNFENSGRRFNANRNDFKNSCTNIDL